ncbi:hypothetical protein BD408DRAFT_422554 [Parasitella parasitica]|nr:hypothetical protein BD408DRAFT_422554 [Parasitella parasitica]
MKIANKINVSVIMRKIETCSCCVVVVSLSLLMLMLMWAILNNRFFLGKSLQPVFTLFLFCFTVS